jgi:hypothetical protein
MTEQQIEDAYEYMKGEHFEDAYRDDPDYLRDYCRAGGMSYLSSRPFPRWPVEGESALLSGDVQHEAECLGDPGFADDVVCT